jgi:deoxyadenosine/deoxycytidine kinase
MTTRSTGRDVYVIGNIASGKTTLARILGERIPQAVYVPEPVDKNPFLAPYLKDQARWGMSCMARYFVDYAREWDALTAGTSFDYHFVDAGTPTNRLLYGRYLENESVISAAELEFYATICDLAEHAYRIPRPHAFVYVRAESQVCMERMRARGWPFQVVAVELAYVQKLQRYLEEMVQILIDRHFPVLELSSEAIDFRRPDEQEQAVARVAAFLSSLVQEG